MGRKLTTEDFIEHSKKVHGNKYDYSNSIYITANTDINIGCSQHGTFNQRASVHMGGGRCPKCVGRNKDVGEIIKNLTLKHGDKYDYSLVEYVNATTPIKIRCPQHGTFEQTYNTHLKGHGCPNCSGNKSHTTESFINKSVGTHGNKYDYSKCEYSNNRGKLIIGCPIHGEFEQLAEHHLNGHGCPKCGQDKTVKHIRKDTNQFIKESVMVHGDKYDYTISDYNGIKESITIICPEHGEFEQQAMIHLMGCGCQKCGKKYIKSESEVKDFIIELGLEVLSNTKKVINPLELDIFIPSHNIAIEFDGLYWHSEQFVDYDYHLKKTELCEEKGIQLIHIFEDEWTHSSDVVKSRLRNILGLTPDRIYARKCEIREVLTKEAKEFSNNNHLQGYSNSKFKLGLYHENKLVSLMLFGKARAAMGGGDEMELIRFCNLTNTNVVGGASKLLKYFAKVYQPKEIISYADRRWSQGKLYNNLGFEMIRITKPNYWYIMGNKRKHRFGFRKSILINKGYDETKTEREIMLDRGIYRIYDCGVITCKKSLI
jgi:hypothetical protein